MEEIFGSGDLIAAAKLKELSLKSDLRGLVRLGGHSLAFTARTLLRVLHRGAWHEPPVKSLPLRNRARA